MMRYICTACGSECTLETNETESFKQNMCMIWNDIDAYWKYEEDT